ncbi:hypothetical protein NYR68_07340 [Actinobacillus equuli subsp. haemolyticus]|uniref:calcium-binding protein n=1 Tax=Actinobacillus equuli TaxID=718 RepID=UPI0024466159|nr:hypothetical protein [Actinobacillus equuli]WGE50084.1 hypothetical protein NYR68_07340 [Actinobacillus equuli subsp. haemolyticus]
MYVARITHSISVRGFINSFFQSYGRFIFKPSFGQQSTLEQKPIDVQKPDFGQKPIQFDEPDFGQKPIDPQRPIDPQQPVPQEPVPQEPVPQEPVPQEPVPQEPVPQEPVPQEPVPQEPVPQEPVPQEPVPQQPVEPQEPTDPQDPNCGCPEDDAPTPPWEADNQIFGDECDNVLCGTEAKDMLDGGAGNDTLYGFGGHDNLFGGEGHDILVGGLGAGDYLSGGVGSDTYIFSGDFGHDVVADKGAKSDFDLIRFTDLSADEVTFSLKGSNLFITDTTDEGNYIEVVNYLNDGANSIEQFDFKDGSATVDVVYNANGSCDICVSYTPLQQEQVSFYA